MDQSLSGEGAKLSKLIQGPVLLINLQTLSLDFSYFFTTSSGKCWISQESPYSYHACWHPT